MANDEDDHKFCNVTTFYDKTYKFGATTTWPLTYGDFKDVLTKVVPDREIRIYLLKITKNIQSQ